MPASPPNPAPNAAARRVGTVLGNYDLLRIVGKGGMAVVYEAEDRILGRRVALKVLNAKFADDPEYLHRFHREAKAAAKVRHPNVVGLYEANQVGGVFYIAMPLIDGGSAQEFLRTKKRFRWDEATRVIADVCRGLAAAHAAGLIHRDIKPANIMRSLDGKVMLADFGLVKPTDGTTLQSITGSGSVVGTPEFMSPEQCTGQALDPRSDIYGLGATFFALLIGHSPFTRPEPLATMYAHVNEPIPDPRSWIEDIPEACVRVLRRALAKSPDDRHQSALEMLGELERILSQPQIEKESSAEWEELFTQLSQARLKSPVTAIRKRSRSGNRAVAAVMATLAIGVLVAGAFALHAWMTSGPASKTGKAPDPPDEVVVDPPVDPVRLPPDGPIIVDPPTPKVEPDPAVAIARREFDELRAFADRGVREKNRTMMRLAIDRRAAFGRKHEVSSDPIIKELVAQARRPEPRLSPPWAIAIAEYPVARDVRPPFAAHFDMLSVGVGRPDGFDEISLTDGRVISCRLHDSALVFGPVSGFPEHSRHWMVVDGGRLAYVERGVDEVVFLPSRLTQPPACMGQSGSNHFLFVGTDAGSDDLDARLVVWDAQRLKHVVDAPAHKRRIDGVHASPDGNTVVTVGADRLVRLWDPCESLLWEGTIGGGTRFRTDWSGESGAERVGRSGNRGILAVGGDDGAVEIWDTLARKRLTRIESAHPPGTPVDVALSLDCSRVVTFSGSDGKLRLFDLPSGAPAGPAVAACAPHANARLAAVSSRKLMAVHDPTAAKISVWDVDTGFDLPSTHPAENVGRLIWSDDFESQPLGVHPRGWRPMFNALVERMPGTGEVVNAVDDRHAVSGKQSLRLYGSQSALYYAATLRRLEATGSVRVELWLRGAGDAILGGHGFGLKLELVRDFSADPQHFTFVQTYNGAGRQCGRWSRMVFDFRRREGKTVYSVHEDDRIIHGYTHDADFIRDLPLLRLNVGNGNMWIDDVKVFALDD